MLSRAQAFDITRYLGLNDRDYPQPESIDFVLSNSTEFEHCEERKKDGCQYALQATFDLFIKASATEIEHTAHCVIFKE